MVASKFFPQSHLERSKREVTLLHVIAQLKSVRSLRLSLLDFQRTPLFFSELALRHSSSARLEENNCIDPCAAAESLLSLFPHLFVLLYFTGTIRASGKQYICCGVLWPQSECAREAVQMDYSHATSNAKGVGKSVLLAPHPPREVSVVKEVYQGPFRGTRCVLSLLH